MSPLDREPVKARSPGVVAAVGAAIAHAAFVIAANAAASTAVYERRPLARVTQMIDVELARPAPEPAPAAAEPARPAPARARATRARHETPPPSAAQAAPVHAVANDSVDFGETFVAGAAKTLTIGMKKYVAPAGSTSVDPVILLNFTPTSVTSVACGVQAAAHSKVAEMMVAIAILIAPPACGGPSDPR